MLHAPGIPQNPRVSDEPEGGSKTFFEALLRTACGGGFFGHQILLILQLLKLGFIGGDDRAALRLDEAADELINLAVDRLKLARCCVCLLLGGYFAGAPEQLQHGVCREQKFLRWAEPVQQAVEITLKFFLADVLAGKFTSFGEAPVVGVALAFAAARPGGGHGPVAAGAVHKAAQRKVVIEIHTSGRDGRAAKAFLNLEEGLVADQCLVFCGDAIKTPFGHAHVPGIERLGQDRLHLLRVDAARAVLGEERIVLQEPLHLGLRLEAA